MSEYWKSWAEMIWLQIPIHNITTYKHTFIYKNIQDCILCVCKKYVRICVNVWHVYAYMYICAYHFLNCSLTNISQQVAWGSHTKPTNAFAAILHWFWCIIRAREAISGVFCINHPTDVYLPIHNLPDFSFSGRKCPKYGHQRPKCAFAYIYQWVAVTFKLLQIGKIIFERIWKWNQCGQHEREAFWHGELLIWIFF